MHPIIFSFGVIHLYSYGFLVAIGVLSAIFLIRRNAKWILLNPDISVDLAMTTVVSGFIGARIFYVLQHWSFFRGVPLDALKIWEGGIVLYGGLIGGLIGFFLFVKWRGLSFLAMLDLFVPATALAQGFGRLGCFLNGCCFGRESKLPWAVKFPFLDEKVHPTQIYESIYCFALAFFLYHLWKRRKTDGTVALAYFILYPIGRFFIEFLRGDQRHYFLNFTLAQWMSLLFLAVAFYFFRIRKSSRGKNSADRSS